MWYLAGAEEAMLDVEEHNGSGGGYYYFKPFVQHGWDGERGGYSNSGVGRVYREWFTTDNGDANEYYVY
jgi:hypothetical protein